MNKLLISLVFGALFVGGCKQEGASIAPSGTPTPSVSQVPDLDGPKGPIVNLAGVVGTWKVDLARTTVPTETDAAKAEEKSARLDIMSDGTYATSGGHKPQTGKWTLVGDQLTIRPDSVGDSAPPSFTVAPDSSTMSVQIRQGDVLYTFAMIKA